MIDIKELIYREYLSDKKSVLLEDCVPMVGNVNSTQC